MSDVKKPNPIDDVRRGLGLLFRAAKTAVETIPHGSELKDKVVSSAEEVGRAAQNVAQTIGKQVFGSEKDAPHAAKDESSDKTDASKPDGSDDKSG